MMNKFSKILFGIIAICVLMFYQPLEGQVVFGQPPTGEMKFIYQSWTLTYDDGDEIKLSQWVVPINVYVPISDNWEVMLSSSTAGSSLDLADGSESSLSGLNDTRFSVYRSFLDDRVLLGVGLNLPTGKKALDNDEVGITNLLTESFLNMPVKNYGEGFGLHLEGGYAHKVDIYSFGAGAGYTIKGSYEPLNGSTDYKPGNHLRLGGFASVAKDRFTGSFSLIYNAFGEDKLDGEPLFKDGSMVDIRLIGGYANESIATSLGLRGILRGKDKRITSDVLETEAEKSHGTETRVFGRISYALNEKYVIRALVDYKGVAANGYDEGHVRYFGSSNYFGIGFGGSGLFGEILRGFAEFEYFSGSADDGDIDLSGWEIALGLGATF
jgi:hypothetical protein